MKSSETDENAPSQAPLTPTSSSHNHNNGSFPFINTSSYPFSFHTPMANIPTSESINSLSFIDGFTPVQKKRKVTRKFTAEDILNSCNSRKVQDQAEETWRQKEVERMQLEEEDSSR
jgi:hypothetical protein